DVVTVGIFVICDEIYSRPRCHSLFRASWSSFRNISTALTMPTISSFPYSWPRAMMALCGILLRSALATSSFLPVSKRLPGGRGATGDEYGVALGQLQHFSDAPAGGDFEIRNAAEMFSTKGHDFLDFRPRERAAKNGHGSLPVDDGRDAEFFENISGGPEASELTARGRRRAGAYSECFDWAQHGGGKRAEHAEKCSAIRLIFEHHGATP